MSRPPHGYRNLPPGTPSDADAGELVGAVLLALVCIAIAIAVVVLAPR